MKNKANWKCNVVAFLSSQVVSIFGSSMVQYAIIWHITLKTQSGVFAMISILCNLLPMFLLMPFVGVWADRYNRKFIIIIADCFMAMIALIVAILYSMRFESISILLVALFLRSFGAAVQNPCVNAMIPDFVPIEKLTRINSIYTTVYSVTQIIAPLLAATFISLFPLAYIFYIDVVTALLATMILGFGLKIAPQQKSAETRREGSYWSDIKDGVIYILKTPFLRSLFLFMTSSFFMVTPVFYLTPLYVTRTYGEEVWYLSAIEVVLTMGMLVGGILMATWGGFKDRKCKTLILGSIMMASMSIVMGLPIPLWGFFTAMGIYGLANAIMGTPQTVIMQQYSDEKYIGRVFSAYSFLNTSIMQIAMLIFGPLADVIDIRWLLLFSGCFMFVASLLLLRSKALKNM